MVVTRELEGGETDVARAGGRHNYKEIVIYPLGKPICVLPALRRHQSLISRK